jgi:hypothetical protein
MKIKFKFCLKMSQLPPCCLTRPLVPYVAAKAMKWDPENDENDQANVKKV